ncbi:hypothetical protein L7F22_026393 [Adiantum nelumboides]|nr:hypothetical protein [Adiantum nelumboides]
MDVSKELPQSITIALDDGESFEQSVFYKYLPNACFHCKVKGHFVRDCPAKNPLASKPNPNSVSSTPQPKTHLAESQRNFTTQSSYKNRFQRGADDKRPTKQANMFALLTTIPEWEDSKVPELSCAALEDEKNSSSRLEKQVQELDSEMAIEINKTKNQELENKENVPPHQRSFRPYPYGNP